MNCNQQRCALHKVTNDILQLFPLLLSKKAARETLSHLCLWLQLRASVRLTTLLCWITAVWTVTTSILSWRLWGIISTVTGDNNQIMTGPVILWTAAASHITALMTTYSQPCFHLLLPLYLSCNLYSSVETWGSFSALYNTYFYC